MEESVTHLFFFMQKIHEEKERIVSAINNLYDGVKEDEASKLISNKQVQRFGKEISSQILVEILGVTFFELLEKNWVLCQQHLLAYHAKNSYKLKVSQKAIELHELRNRR